VGVGDHATGIRRQQSLGGSGIRTARALSGVHRAHATWIVHRAGAAACPPASRPTAVRKPGDGDRHRRPGLAAPAGERRMPRSVTGPSSMECPRGDTLHTHTARRPWMSDSSAEFGGIRTHRGGHAGLHPRSRERRPAPRADQLRTDGPGSDRRTSADALRVLMHWQSPVP
jgi:hypothetical protein